MSLGSVGRDSEELALQSSVLYCREQGAVIQGSTVCSSSTTKWHLQPSALFRKVCWMHTELKGMKVPHLCDYSYLWISTEIAIKP